MRGACGRKGFVAAAIDRFCRTQDVMDTSGTPHRGVLTGDDMARWSPRTEAPLAYDYGRHTVLKAGPWSQGPVVLQQLALLKGFDLDRLEPTDPDFIHLVVECSKLAYADRETFYGDPDFVDVPMQELLSDRYNDARRKLIGERASLDLVPGRIDGYGKRIEMRLADGGRVAPAQASRPSARSPGRTTTKTTRASRPRASSPSPAWARRAATPCISTSSTRPATWCRRRRRGGWLQSSPVIPELGFCLGTRAQQFWLDEGHPNALAPGKRPRTTLTPTMALRDGEPYLCWGTPGGDQQDQWVALFFLRHAHAG